MKLLYVITRSDQFGGAHVHVRDLAVHFSSLGHEVSVVVGGSGSYIQQLKDNNINVFAISCLRRSINPILDFMAALKLRKIIRDYNPDIVSAHSAKAGLLQEFYIDISNHIVSSLQPMVGHLLMECHSRGNVFIYS